MSRIMERSLMQTLYKYLPGSYADFDLDGYSIVARVMGWNASIQENENKNRISYEVINRIRRLDVDSNVTKRQDNFNTQKQDLFFAELFSKRENAFDVYGLKGKRDEDDKVPEIATVVRPYVFYCSKCGLIHIITDYKLTESVQYLNNYKYRIFEIFDHRKHKCIKCGSTLKQQQLIRIDSSGNALDYEPNCDIHKENTEYFLKKDSVFDYRCSVCNKTIKRAWRFGEKLTPALDPSAFFPHTISILDIKSDEKINELEKYPNLAKLLTVHELGVITFDTYTRMKNASLEYYNQFGCETSSFKYIKFARESGIDKVIKVLNMPAFDTYEQQNSESYYNNVANKLIDITEINSKGTFDYEHIIKENVKYDQADSETELQSLLDKLCISDIIISEEVPINDIAFGFTRMSSEIGFDPNEQAILNVYPTNDKKYKFYSNKLKTEGVFFRFDAEKLLDWCKNSIYKKEDDKMAPIFIKTHEHPNIDLFNNFIKDGESHDILYTVIHTISHILMKEIANTAGLEISALSEMLFPDIGGIFIYCTSVEGVVLNSIKTAITRRLSIIARKALDSIHRCNLRNICNTNRISACLGCIYIPELSCTLYNKYLNRKFLNATKDTSSGLNSIDSEIIIKKGLWI